MKLAKIKNDGVETIGAFDEKNASISAENQGFIFDLVSKGMYKDPISSMIREITSNCFDAHVAANKLDEPVIIRIKNNQIHFIDKGVGMDKDFFENVYFSWFSSTKRESDEFIGAFGLGSKSPFAYSEDYKLVTTKDGIQYIYLLSSLGDEGKPVYSLLSESETTDGNGTTVIVDIQSGDLYDFERKLKTQLAYFNNVYVESDTYQLSYDNEYKIYEKEFKNFKFRTNSPFAHTHICINTVYYPIDFSQLSLEFADINKHSLPIALKFNIGDLIVTPERESLRYTKEVIQKIENKLKDTYAEIVEIVSRDCYSHDLFDVLWFYHQKASQRHSYRDTSKDIILKDVNFTISNNHYLYNKVNEKIYTPFKDFNFIEYISFANVLTKYEIYGEIKDNGDFKRTPRTKTINLKFEHIVFKDKYTVYLLPDDKEPSSVVNRIKNLYIRDSEGLNINTKVFIVRQKKVKYEYYKRLFNLPSIKKVPLGWNISKIIKQIKEHIHQMVVYNTTAYDEIDSTHFKKVLKDRETKLLNNKLTIGIASCTSTQVHFYDYELNYNKLKECSLIVYGNRNDKSKLEYVSQLFTAAGYSNTILEKYILTVKTKNTMFKKLNELNNSMHIDHFIDNVDEKFLKKAISNVIIINLIKDDKILSTETILKELLPDFYNNIAKPAINAYSNIHYKSYNIIEDIIFKKERISQSLTIQERVTKEVTKSVILNCIKRGNLTDEAKKAIKLKKFVEKNSLLKYIEYNEHTVPVIIEYLKNNKEKVDNIWYSDLKHPWEIELFNETKEKLLYLKQIGREINVLNLFTYKIK